MRVLVLADISRRIEKEFPELEFHYMGYALEERIPLPSEILKSVIGDYDIVISEFDTINKEVIDCAKKLKLIICCRGGVHSVVDVPYASKRGIVVKHTPGRNSASVAEYVLGTIFTMDRKLFFANAMVLAERLQEKSYYLPSEYKDSLWGMDKASPYHVFRGKGIHNFTLGVIGYGNVGRTVVNMAVLLGIHVLVYNHHTILSPIPAGVEIVDLDYLLKNSDFVSLHCNNRKHEVVIGKQELAKMKDGAYFINTARGDLVDEEALIQALESGKLAGAALDVTRKEPLEVGDPLVHAPNIFITPHIAGSTDEVIEKGTDMAIYFLREYITEYMDD